jgi:acetyl esterase/lipase
MNCFHSKSRIVCLTSTVAFVVALVLGFHADVSLAEKSSELHPVKSHVDIEFAKPGGIPLLLDLFVPTGLKEKPPLVLFIHGGGWRQGDRKKNKLDWLPENGYAVASIEYRLSHEAIFPAQIHDCQTALDWLREHAAEFGYDPSRVIVAGASAGGHLAALMGVGKGVAEMENSNAEPLKAVSRIIGILDYYGATDLIARAALQPEECEQPNGKVYRLLGGKVSQKTDLARLASPLSHVSPDDPPLLILHGELDTTVPVSQSELLRDRYQSLGLEVQLHIKPGAGHGWTKSDETERHLVLSTLARWMDDQKANSTSR